MADTGRKKAVFIGAIVGAVMTLGIALSMDLLYSDALQGTWWDAAAKDTTKMFGPACGQSAIAVTLVLLFVMGLLAGFGALLGAAAGLVMDRFFKLVLKL